jgi:hypothetical protein
VVGDRLRLRLQAVRDLVGRMFRSRLWTRASASSRCRAKVASRTNATNETPAMLSAANALTAPSGISAGSGRTTGARGIVATRSARNAPNQSHARKERSRTSAPSGARSDQRITPLDAARPPSARRSSAGVTRISASSVFRRNEKLRVRAYTTSAVADAAV